MNATVAAEAPSASPVRLLERNLVPDWLIRRGIRKLLAQRLREENMGNPEAQQKRLMDLIARLKAKPDRHQHHRCEPAALRGPDRVLPERARAEPEVFVLLLREARRHARSRSRSACSPSPASGPVSRMVTRSWNWAAAGVAQPVHGEALPQLAHRRRLELSHPSSSSMRARRGRACPTSIVDDDVDRTRLRDKRRDRL